ncbi:MAG TPA: CHAD domain-containing protein [Prosthecobacter sp.]|nr:CHAD domain-containing protein [Prosthecobacter sp.]
MEKPVPEVPAAGEWLKALLLQLVDRAAFDLDDLDANPGLALHRLRLRMKKAEALLRLSKGAVRKTSRWQLRKQIKDIKQVGSDQRDAEVIEELAKELGRKYGLHLAMAPIQRRKPNRGKLRDLLGQLRRGLSEEIFDGLTWEDVEDNYSACYRSGRRRMRVAQRTLAAEDLHRWRKRVKALYYQSQALGSTLSHSRHRLNRMRKLGKMLGRDHDLTLLEQETAEKSPDNPWQEVIQTRREKLRRQILSQGEGVYKPAAHRFARMRGQPL